MSIENTVEVTLSAWQAQLEQVRQRRLERGGGHAGAWPIRIRFKARQVCR